MHLRGDMNQRQIFKVKFLAGVVYVDAGQITFAVVVQHNAGEISLLSTLLLEDRSMYKESVSA